jgi:uncharacterized membrane protein
MRIASAGHALFALVFIALGVQGLIKGDFTSVWQPVPKGIHAREVLVYFCAVVSLGCGVGLLARRGAPTASRVLLATLVVWMLLWRVPPIVHAPGKILTWDGCAETAAMVAGSWVLFAWFATPRDRRRLGFATGDRGLRIARVFYGLALIPFGLAHFAYPQETAALVPRWLPWHLVWAYVTGGAFLAAGAGVLLRFRARLAAALSALQIGLFTLLVWVPIVAAGTKDPFQWSELAISSALTAAAWVVADSYRPRLHQTAG